MRDTVATAATPPALSTRPNRRERRAARFGTRAEVAEYLGVPVGTLVAWAYRKSGPPYKLIGRHARYDWAAVDAWVDAQASGGAA